MTIDAKQVSAAYAAIPMVLADLYALQAQILYIEGGAKLQILAAQADKAGFKKNTPLVKEMEDWMCSIPALLPPEIPRFEIPEIDITAPEIPTFDLSPTKLMAPELPKH